MYIKAILSLKNIIMLATCWNFLCNEFNTEYICSMLKLFHKTFLFELMGIEINRSRQWLFFHSCFVMSFAFYSFVKFWSLENNVNAYLFYTHAKSVVHIHWKLQLSFWIRIYFPCEAQLVDANCIFPLFSFFSDVKKT